MNGSRPDMARFIRAWLDVVASGPGDAWPACAADDIVIRLPFAPGGVPNELRGLAQALATFEPVWKGKKRFTWHDVVIRATEDSELFLITARSEAVLVSGQPYANDYVILIRIRDGRVVEHTEYFNPLPVIALYGQRMTS